MVQKFNLKGDQYLKYWPSCGNLTNINEVQLIGQYGFSNSQIKWINFPFQFSFLTLSLCYTILLGCFCRLTLLHIWWQHFIFHPSSTAVFGPERKSPVFLHQGFLCHARSLWSSSAVVRKNIPPISLGINRFSVYVVCVCDWAVSKEIN